jgi:hypothetical protein
MSFGLRWRARTACLGIASAVAASVFFAGVFLASTAWAATSQELFRIERSTNRNAVVYAARVGDGGELDGKQPISAFWLMLEKGGKREELTWLEREFAYGFSTSRDQHGLLLRLTAFDKRALRVQKHDARYRAEVRIAGKKAQLKRIWVQADEGIMGPNVRYVELDGTDVETGEHLTERIAKERDGARARR